MSGEFTAPSPAVVAVQGPGAPEKLKRLVDPRDYEVRSQGELALAAGRQRHVRAEARSGLRRDLISTEEGTASGGRMTVSSAMIKK